MKMTLLAMVQDILSDLDSDEVNHIDDTVEAQQIAQIIKSCYYEILDRRIWPHTYKLLQLDASGTLDRPNYLKLPDNINELTSVKYDKQTLTNPKVNLQDVKYKPVDDFLRLVSARDSTATNIENIKDIGGTSILVFNDVAPTYWTSFDDTYIVTDSYDKAVDDTLKKSKTQCQAYVVPAWNRIDGFIPDLPIDAFSLLLEESKSTAFMTLKQMANQKSEQKAKRQHTWLSRKSWRAEGGIRFPDFGRSGRR